MDPNCLGGKEACVTKGASTLYFVFFAIYNCKKFGDFSIYNPHCQKILYKGKVKIKTISVVPLFPWMKILYLTGRLVIDYDVAWKLM